MEMGKIEGQIYEILKNKFVSENWLSSAWKNSKDVFLTGVKWGLNSIDLTYLFLEVEKQFDISIDGSYLENYGFSTINQIMDIIALSINVNTEEY